MTSQETPVKFMNVFGLFAKPFLVCLYCKVTSLIFEWQVRSVPVSIWKKNVVLHVIELIGYLRMDFFEL